MGTLSVQGVGPETDIRGYTQKLFQDLTALEYMIKEGMIEEGVTRLGAEQELCLVGKDFQPAALAEEVLSELQDEHFTTELAKFNLEINLDPFLFTGSCLRQWQEQLDQMLQKCQKAAAKYNCLPLLTGILPTIRKSELQLSFMTDRLRYHALNKALYGLRNSPYDFRIQGIDELITQHDSVMFESCNTSFQVHYQVGAIDFCKRYNWAQAIAAPVLAAATNAPLFLGKRLWHETRIALFQQATDTRGNPDELRKTSARVHFGHDWLRGDLTELIKSDISTFRPLVIREGLEHSLEVLQAGGIPKLKAFALFNGTIYRWNRPCYGITAGKPHLRIENRYLPAGPSAIDEVANGAFWLGLMHAPEIPDITQLMDFDAVKENFRMAARQGLGAAFNWYKSSIQTAGQLICDELIPLSRSGLIHAGVDAQDIDYYLNVVQERVQTRKTGSNWILQNYNALNKVNREEASLLKLTEALYRNQEAPVSQWPDVKPTDLTDRPAQFQRIDQIMSRKLFTVGEHDLVDLVPNIMKWNKVRHMLVEDQQGRLKGIITLGRLGKYYAERKPQEDAVKVKDIMNSQVISIESNTPTHEAIKLMDKHQIGCLPVVNQHQHLVGIVTEKDFMPIAASYFQLCDQLQDRM